MPVYLSPALLPRSLLCYIIIAIVLRWTNLPFSAVFIVRELVLFMMGILDTQSWWVVIIFVRVGGHSCWGSCGALACINRWLWPGCKFKNKFQKFMLWTTSFQTEHVSAVHKQLLSSRIQGLFVFCLSSIWFPFSLLLMWMFYGLLY